MFLFSIDAHLFLIKIRRVFISILGSTTAFPQKVFRFRVFICIIQEKYIADIPVLMACFFFIIDNSKMTKTMSNCLVMFNYSALGKKM